MGFITVAAFDFGFYMGLASYLASTERDTDAIQMLHSAQPSVNLLSSENIIYETNLVQDFKGFKEPLERIVIPLRTSYENEMRSHSKDAANAYRLGLIMALAQGHTSEPFNASKQLDLLRAKLLQSQRFIKENLNNVPLNTPLYQAAFALTENGAVTSLDRLAAIEQLRIFYRDAILLSPDVF